MSEKIVVKVNEGKIQGIKEQSVYSRTPYYAFYGIPYGEPPVNNLRFKDPVKVKSWTNVYDGTKEKQGCVQLSILKRYEYLGTEDCLFNNIYTQSIPRKGEPLKPVIVNIHGGSYLTGSPHTNHYGSPSFVMQHEVVYICISYRLHILGFLNLGLEECSGNQALKDIILGLHWIKDNATAFGGDPDNITLLGCSSGAATIHLLMLSPAVERNLFHKAVLMSGYLMNPVAPYREIHTDHAREIAKSLKYRGDLNDSARILKFFKRKSALELLHCVLVYQLHLPKTTAPITLLGAFLPTIDDDILPCSPKKLLPSMMRIPIMVGCSEREAVMGFSRDTKKETEDNFYTTFCQSCWGWGYNLKKDEINFIKKETESFYSIEKPIAQIPLPVKVDIQSDICMSDLYDTLIDPISADLPSSVYVYKFEFEGKVNTTIKDAGNFEEIISGTYHGTEYSYWNCFMCNPSDPETRSMVDSFTKLLATFAKYGDPNYEKLQVQWRPSTLENPCYLSIKSPMRMVEGRLNEERLKFWDDMKKKFKTP